MRFVILKIYSPAVCALIVILQIKIEMIPLNFAHSETLPHLFHHVHVLNVVVLIKSISIVL